MKRVVLVGFLILTTRFAAAAIPSHTNFSGTWNLSGQEQGERAQGKFKSTALPSSFCGLSCTIVQTTTLLKVTRSTLQKTVESASYRLDVNRSHNNQRDLQGRLFGVTTKVNWQGSSLSFSTTRDGDDPSYHSRTTLTLNNTSRLVIDNAITASRGKATRQFIYFRK